jgi:hypothetical protein
MTAAVRDAITAESPAAADASPRLRPTSAAGGAISLDRYPTPTAAATARLSDAGGGGQGPAGENPGEVTAVVRCRPQVVRR